MENILSQVKEKELGYEDPLPHVKVHPTLHFNNT